MFHVQHVKWGVCASLGFAGSVCAQGVDVAAKYPLCNDYYTVGSALCAPMPQIPQVSVSVAPMLLPPPATQPAKSPVDEYLESYGKPPREFVEFYLSPTVVNAQKWSAKYHDMLEKTRAISNVWMQLDDPSVTLKTGGVPPVSVSLPLVSQAPEVSINLKERGVRNSITQFSDQIQLTYYFSATCPYCAQMTPLLSKLSSEMGRKLSLTCIDVTPLSPTYAPQPENMRGKLACQWRLPFPDEVAQKQITQTPTLLIKKGDQTEVRVSGYVSADELKAKIAR